MAELKNIYKKSLAQRERLGRSPMLQLSFYTQWKPKSKVGKLAVGSSKHSFEVVDKTDEVSYLYLRQGEADVVWRDFRRILKQNNPSLAQPN